MITFPSQHSIGNVLEFQASNVKTRSCIDGVSVPLTRMLSDMLIQKVLYYKVRTCISIIDTSIQIQFDHSVTF